MPEFHKSLPTPELSLGIDYKTFRRDLNLHWYIGPVQSTNVLSHRPKGHPPVTKSRARFVVG